MRRCKSGDRRQSATSSTCLTLSGTLFGKFACLIEKTQLTNINVQWCTQCLKVGKVGPSIRSTPQKPAQGSVFKLQVVIVNELLTYFIGHAGNCRIKWLVEICRLLLTDGLWWEIAWAIRRQGKSHLKVHITNVQITMNPSPLSSCQTVQNIENTYAYRVTQKNLF